MRIIMNIKTQGWRWCKKHMDRTEHVCKEGTWVCAECIEDHKKRYPLDKMVGSVVD